MPDTPTYIDPLLPHLLLHQITNIMKYGLLLLSWLLLSQAQAQDTTHVLFIGNSITYFNTMPQTFEAIANDLGDHTAVTMYAPGGTGFVHHENDANVYAHFRQKAWDYVILQPGSNESPGYTAPIAHTLRRARRLIDSIHVHAPCAKVLFHEISYGVWGNSAQDINTYTATMDLIRANLTLLADSTQSFFAPVGEAFRTKWLSDTNDLLWGSYGDIHPNAKGSYLAACTFYATIFEKSPLGTQILGGLSNQAASALQRLSDTLVLQYKNDWRIGRFTPSAAFTAQIHTDTVNFQLDNAFIDSVHWDFGDGTYSTALAPSKIYSHNGPFNVVAHTYKNGCLYTHSETINLPVLASTKATQVQNMRVFPNPSAHTLHIDLAPTSAPLHYTVFDLLGRPVLHGQGHRVSLQTLTRGTYILRANQAGKQYSTRFIKE